MRSVALLETDGNPFFPVLTDSFEVTQKAGTRLKEG